MNTVVKVARACPLIHGQASSEIASIVLLSAALLAAGAACGQAYPSRPIRFVTAAVGGGNDFAARMIATGLPRPRPAVHGS
jgi:hypothetical protein